MTAAAKVVKILLCLLCLNQFHRSASFQFGPRLSIQHCTATRNVLCPLYLKTGDSRRGEEDFDDDESSSQRKRISRNDFEDSDENYEMDEEIDRKMKSRFPDSTSSDRKRKPKSKTIVKDLNKWEVVNRAVLAGVFVAGIGSGITIDSAINTNPRDLASRDAIDKNAPNPKLCATYGSSAMVLDQRVFITFNPFNVYVTQADTKPGCVLRPSNVVSFLQKERSLITDEEVDACKNGYNTWAYIGDINNKPQLNCVFQSDDAQNEFLSNPKVGLGEDIYDDEKANFGKTMKQLDPIAK